MRQTAPDEASEDLSERELAKADREAAALLLHTAALLREEAACDRNLAALHRHEAALDRHELARLKLQDKDKDQTESSSNLSNVVALLQQAADAVDGLWNEARVMRGGDLRMALADASHGVHRALIALRNDRETNEV